MEHQPAYFISLLAAFIHQRRSPEQRQIEWEQVYQLGNIHFVGGMIYLMAKTQEQGNRPPAALLQMMKQDFTSTIVRALHQESEMLRVIDELSRLQIPHLIFKGYAIKNCYPVKEMRTMGDIDILIKPEDREKSHELLQSMGFKPGIVTGEVWSYSKGTVHLEIHTQLLVNNINNKFDYMNYFSDVWDKAVMQPNGYTYEFSVNDHLLYMLVHMAKHFYGYGCGIRMVMDAAMYMIYFEKELDWGYLERELKKLNLVLFAHNIFALCRRWFEVSPPIKLPTMKEGLYELIGEYILSGGPSGRTKGSLISSCCVRFIRIIRKSRRPL
ncbi:hypothetical protein SK3146_05110 [Paenibacillus konkukensis]|uniref:Nucleotidyltransferase family protein n=1 Tax=Paenibacillus konkukensis TaxID=2020716 RepID=A0ABY4RTB6_9BACL|nr:nucleotidyltransferase family protein [Paenibacillus konkukensis]UQZ85821.1 hypothetical protein SK3146_05110 [Paenibacillus konkukensis]